MLIKCFLLAPTGALIVMMCYYRSGHFSFFSWFPFVGAYLQSFSGHFFYYILPWSVIWKKMGNCHFLKLQALNSLRLGFYCFCETEFQSRRTCWSEYFARNIHLYIQPTPLSSVEAEMPLWNRYLDQQISHILINLSIYPQSEFSIKSLCSQPVEEISGSTDLISINLSGRKFFILLRNFARSLFWNLLMWNWI